MQLKDDTEPMSNNLDKKLKKHPDLKKDPGSYKEDIIEIDSFSSSSQQLDSKPVFKTQSLTLKRLSSDDSDDLFLNNKPLFKLTKNKLLFNKV